jgi:hypothetical protein
MIRQVVGSNPTRPTKPQFTALSAVACRIATMLYDRPLAPASVPGAGAGVVSRSCSSSERA